MIGGERGGETVGGRGTWRGCLLSGVLSTHFFCRRCALSWNALCKICSRCRNCARSSQLSLEREKGGNFVLNYK
jgi:hypothetical protein